MSRYLRLNYLIRPFKELMDKIGLPLLVAVDVSYMPGEQQALYNLTTENNLKITSKMVAQPRKASGTLDEDKMIEIIDGLKAEKNVTRINLKLPQALCSKYFEGMEAEVMATIVEQALDAFDQLCHEAASTPEICIDEINEEIAVARAKRKARKSETV